MIPFLENEKRSRQPFDQRPPGIVLQGKEKIVSEITIPVAASMS